MKVQSSSIPKPEGIKVLNLQIHCSEIIQQLMWDRLDAKHNKEFCYFCRQSV